MKVSNINSVPIYGANISVDKKQNNIKQQNVMSNVVMCHNNPLVDKNYGILQTKKMNVSFKGGLPALPTKTLSGKINNLFNIVKTNDIIVTAPNYNHAIESLKNNVENIKTVIKRVFFVEDKSLDRAIGFRKNLGDREAINLSDKPLMIKDSKNELGFLRKGESGYLLDGDTINPGKTEINIKNDETTYLPIKDSFDMFLDFDKEVEDKIKQINENSLSLVKTGEKETKKEHKITFADVGGMDSTIKELKKTILYPIKHPEIKNGKNMRQSVLLYGPPGTGKSFVAEACANESGAWFKKINASELDSKWVGESEKNWRDLFTEARKNQPSVIFIDEIDAIAKKRGGSDVYGDKTLNTILGLMSDSEKRGDQIYMIAATNKKDALDSAILRSGRISVAIEVKEPDLKGTGDILGKYIENEPIAEDFDRSAAAQKLFKQKATGADIASVTEDARNYALERENIYEKIDNGTYKPEDMASLRITNEDFDNALNAFAKSHKSSERKPIGFNSSLY